MILMGLPGLSPSVDETEAFSVSVGMTAGATVILQDAWRRWWRRRAPASCACYNKPRAAEIIKARFPVPSDMETLLKSAVTTHY